MIDFLSGINHCDIKNSLKKSLVSVFVNMSFVFVGLLLTNIFGNFDYFIAVIFGIINGIIIGKVVINSGNKKITFIFTILISIILYFILNTTINLSILFSSNDKSFDGLTIYTVKIIMVIILEVLSLIFLLFTLLINYLTNME